jgi:hypothetical protein
MNGYRTPLLAGIIGLLLVAAGFGLGRVTSGSGNSGTKARGETRAEMASSSCGDPYGEPNKLVIVTYRSGGGSGICAVGGTPYQDVTAGAKPKLGVFMVMMGELLSPIPLSGQNGLASLRTFGVPRPLAGQVMAEFDRLRAAGKSLTQIQIEMPHWAEAHRSLFHFTPA